MGRAELLEEPFDADRAQRRFQPLLEDRVVERHLQEVAHGPTERGDALRAAAAGIPRSLVDDLPIAQVELERPRDALQHLVRVMAEPDAPTSPDERTHDGEDIGSR